MKDYLSYVIWTNFLFYFSILRPPYRFADLGYVSCLAFIFPEKGFGARSENCVRFIDPFRLTLSLRTATIIKIYEKFQISCCKNTEKKKV